MIRIPTITRRARRPPPEPTPGQVRPGHGQADRRQVEVIGDPRQARQGIVASSTVWILRACKGGGATGLPVAVRARLQPAAGIFFLSAILVAVVNLLVDILYVILDPRIRLG